jgi:hypothetical protein
MGLQDKLLNQGSTLSKNNGGNNETLGGSSRESRLHGTPNGDGGYSLNGSNFTEVNQNYQEYSDGIPNTLPSPSALDINGIKPISALKDPASISLNNTFKFGTYKDNAPEGSNF